MKLSLMSKVKKRVSKVKKRMPKVKKREANHHQFEGEIKQNTRYERLSPYMNECKPRYERLQVSLDQI